jgi:hypothetical protein
MTPEPGTDAGVAVTLVRADAPGPTPAVSPTRPLGSQQDEGERLRLMPLPGGNPDRQDDAVAITDQVDFRAEAPLRPSQRMVWRLWDLHRLGPIQARRHLGIFFSPRRRPARHG